MQIVHALGGVEGHLRAQCEPQRALLQHRVQTALFQEFSQVENVCGGVGDQAKLTEVANKQIYEPV